MLGSESTLGVERHGVTAMLVLVDVGDVDAEEGVGEPRWAGRVGEGDVDDVGAEEGEGENEAPGAEGVPGVEGPNYAVVVWVEEEAVLLEDLGEKMLVGGLGRFCEAKH